MTDTKTLTVLYTANIDGRLDFMPRMATLIQRERNAAEGPVVLLDGGSLCSFDVWPCAVTKMRAGRTMVEAMGYDAAALAGTDILPLGEIGPAGVEVLAEMAGHYESVPPLNASYSHLVSTLKSYTVLEKSGLRIGVVADWQPEAREMKGMAEGSALARPDRDGLGRALATMRNAADHTLLLTMGEPAEAYDGVDVSLWPDAIQSPGHAPALAVRHYATGGGVRLVEEKVVACDESVPVEPTISAVLDLVVEEAARLRGG